MGNPDVELAETVSRETCEHREEWLYDSHVNVGAGWPRLGSHHESAIRCRGCTQVVEMGTLAGRKQMAELLARLKPIPPGELTPKPEVKR